MQGKEFKERSSDALYERKGAFVPDVGIGISFYHRSLPAWCASCPIRWLRRWRGGRSCREGDRGQEGGPRFETPERRGELISVRKQLEYLICREFVPDRTWNSILNYPIVAIWLEKCFSCVYERYLEKKTHSTSELTTSTLKFQDISILNWWHYWS